MALVALTLLGASSLFAAGAREAIEADWVLQAEALGRPSSGGGAVATWADAAGAVDGVKNGRYAFHTAQEKRPWWQVDLGRRRPIARIVVYNRLDYAPGLHNADGLRILTSDDGKEWTLRHDNKGRHFGGVSGAKPLNVAFKAGEVQARYVRLALRCAKPTYFHLDEVEVYGPEEPNRNIALNRPADQSSVSQWSTAKIAAPVGAPAPPLPTKDVIERGRRLAAYCYGKQTAAAGYGLCLIDVFGTKELIYRDPEISCFVPIPLRPRRRPPVLPDVTDPNVSYATCAVSDVGRGVGGVAPGAIRYLRIAQRMPWPYDNTCGGHRYAEKARPNNWTPARVLGTVPVAADGSACFRVPVDTPVYFQLLDANHMELRRMRSFISFQPGEVRGCSGCHETRSDVATAGADTIALRRGPSPLEPAPWGDRVVSFLRDVQPVFSRHCVRCHSGLTPAGGLDYSAGLTAEHNRTFDTIIARRLVAWSNVNEDARVTQPLAFGSRRSKLVAVLRGKAHAKRVKLGADDWLRLVTWIDLNAPYHDRFVNKRPAVQPYDLPADAALARRVAAVHARRCAPCHKPAAVSRLDWIDLQEPRRSLFLTAPLAKAAGGKGKCTKAVYRGPDDPDYKAVLEAVRAAVDTAWARPRRDLKSLTRTPATGRAP